MEKALFYFFLKPLSLLPLTVLYYISDFLFFIFYRVVPYRRKVVLQNLRNSFPEKTEAEINEICEGFYRHFCDLIIECIRLFSMPKAELVTRCKLHNPEFFQKYAQAGKSLLVISGHYNNWELGAMSFDIQIPHQCVGIYKPLNNSFFNTKFAESRSRYGMELVPIKDVNSNFEANANRLTAVLFGADQSPSRSTNVHWMQFLKQDTAVLYGSEKYAVEYNYPVVFARIKKVRRGYYEAEFETLFENPADSAPSAVTEAHTLALEELIREAPQYWLWTHKRWKRKRPVTSNVLSKS